MQPMLDAFRKEAASSACDQPISVCQWFGPGKLFLNLVNDKTWMYHKIDFKVVVVLQNLG